MKILNKRKELHVLSNIVQDNIKLLDAFNYLNTKIDWMNPSRYNLISKIANHFENHYDILGIIIRIEVGTEISLTTKT